LYKERKEILKFFKLTDYRGENMVALLSKKIWQFKVELNTQN